MKSTREILNIFFITLLYCFAIGIISQSLSSSISLSSSQTKKSNYSSIVASSLSLQYSQNENLTESNHTVSSSVFKNPFIGFLAANLATEEFYENTFSLYVKRSTNTLIHFRKTDIIFPFHYFW